MEIIDSRYKNFRFTSRRDADNTSASRHTISAFAYAKELDLRTLASCSRRTASRMTAAGAAILAIPLRARVAQQDADTANRFRPVRW